MYFQVQPLSRLMSSSFSVRSDRFMCRLQQSFVGREALARKEHATSARLAALEKTGSKPSELVGQIALHVSDKHGDDPVIARLQPGLSRGAVLCDHVGLFRIDQLDRDPLHKRDKIRNVPADRRLPFELPG